MFNGVQAFTHSNVEQQIPVQGLQQNVSDSGQNPQGCTQNGKQQLSLVHASNVHGLSESKPQVVQKSNFQDPADALSPVSRVVVSQSLQPQTLPSGTVVPNPSQNVFMCTSQTHHQPSLSNGKTASASALQVGNHIVDMAQPVPPAVLSSSHPLLGHGQQCPQLAPPDTSIVHTTAVTHHGEEPLLAPIQATTLQHVQTQLRLDGHSNLQTGRQYHGQLQPPGVQQPGQSLQPSQSLHGINGQLTMMQPDQQITSARPHAIASHWQPPVETPQSTPQLPPLHFASGQLSTQPPQQPSAVQTGLGDNVVMQQAPLQMIKPTVTPHAIHTHSPAVQLPRRSTAYPPIPPSTVLLASELQSSYSTVTVNHQQQAMQSQHITPHSNYGQGPAQSQPQPLGVQLQTSPIINEQQNMMENSPRMTKSSAALQTSHGHSLAHAATPTQAGQSQTGFYNNYPNQQIDTGQTNMLEKTQALWMQQNLLQGKSSSPTVPPTNFSPSEDHTHLLPQGTSSGHVYLKQNPNVLTQGQNVLLQTAPPNSHISPTEGQTYPPHGPGLLSELTGTNERGLNVQSGNIYAAPQSQASGQTTISQTPITHAGHYIQTHPPSVQHQGHAYPQANHSVQGRASRHLFLPHDTPTVPTPPHSAQSTSNTLTSGVSMPQNGQFSTNVSQQNRGNCFNDGQPATSTVIIQSLSHGAMETPNNPQYPQRAWTAPHGGTRRLFSHTGYHRSQSDTPRSSTDMQNVAPNVQYGQYQGPQQNIPPGMLYQAVDGLGQPEYPPHPQGGGSNIENMPQDHQQPLAKFASHWVRFSYCIVQCHYLRHCNMIVVDHCFLFLHSKDIPNRIMETNLLFHQKSH